jgi:tetratricopeptide (TPR) repeat protein
MKSETQPTAEHQDLADIGYWPAMAYEFFIDGKYAKAVELCRRMLENEPATTSGRIVLAKSLFHAGQFDEAREQFLEVLKQDAANLVALKYLGDLEFRDERIATALAYYHRVLEVDPYCGGLSSGIADRPAETTRRLALKRQSEPIAAKKPPPLAEPAFVTETIADIYRDQGYFLLAGEVYRRLLIGKNDSRIAAKLKEIESKTGIKESKT